MIKKLCNDASAKLSKKVENVVVTIPAFLDKNQGLSSRIANILMFENYSPDDMVERTIKNRNNRLAGMMAAGVDIPDDELTMIKQEDIF